ncbi:glycosyltransferase [Myxococcaceae bacterium GXIMD 01537]
MANIAIIETETSQGGSSSVLGFCRKLRKRGHRVAMVRIPDAEDSIRAEGFEFIPLFADVWPKGALQAEAEEEARTGRWDRRKTAERLQRRFERLRQGALAEALGPFNPDLVAVDYGAPLSALAAHRLGVPVVQFAAMLLSTRQLGVAPLRTGLIPDGGVGFRVKSALAWRQAVLLRWIKSRLFWDEPSAQALLASEVGFPRERIDLTSEFSPWLRLPTLVFCPREFEFPRGEREGVHFVEPSIDLERKEPPLDWGSLDASRPLVYCALGSMAAQIAPDRTRAVLQAFLDAVAERPQWQGLAVIGRAFQVADFRCPPNARLVPEAPQLAVLQRARLMVNHGGFNSVKECIHYGVPQVSLPMFFDHPGYAARVVHHGLGVRGSPSLPAPALRVLMDEVMGNPRYAEKARAMSGVFQAAEARADSVAHVERALETAVRA